MDSSKGSATRCGFAGTIAAFAAAILVSFGGFAQAADFTPHGTQPLLLDILPPENCRSCHSAAETAQNAYAPWNTWAGSMMAHATRDPVFWAALDVANSDVPGVGDYCLRCHAPEAWLQGRVAKDGQGGTVANGANGCALLGDHDDPEYNGVDFGGVGCHACHRQEEFGPSGQVVRRENANLWIDLDGCGGEPCRYGPYQYSEPNITTPPHVAAPSEFVKRGEFCGSCHDVTTPIADTGPLRTLRDGSGADTGIPFPIERTFSEWRASAYADRIFGDGFAEYEPRTQAERYGQTCQACHMRNATEPSALACNFGSPRGGNLPVHEFAGANVWVLRLVKTLYAGLSGLDRAAEIDRSIALAQQMLAASATLQTTILSNSGGTLQARVRVTNLSGHKLPTGYAEGRRMWLEVAAFAGGNPTPFWRSGNYVAATGELQDGNFPPRVYEVKQGIWNATTSTCETEDAQGRDQFHFVLNNCIAKDNRIPPLGFRGGTNIELRPVGATYPETTPGSGVLVNHDDVNYAIPVAGQVGQIEVRATLRHQVASREYIEFLRDEAARVDVPSETDMCAAQRPGGLPTGPRNQRRADFLYDLWTSSGRSPPETMATNSAFTN
jgi:hypothetical protein